jgi:hypothetical protein
VFDVDAESGEVDLLAMNEDEAFPAKLTGANAQWNELAKTAGRLRVRAPKSVFDQVSFMADAITAYLAEYEANYERFMASHGGWEPGWAHTEREWLASTGGKVARDMVRMRGAINAAIENLNVYADTGEAAELFEPSMARFWAEQFSSTD